MVLPRKFRDIAFCVALLGIPVLFLQAALKDPAEINPIDRMLLRFASPIQATVTWAASGIHRGWRRYIFLVRVQEENDGLKEETRRQKFEINEARRQLLHLKRYEQLLGFRNSRQVETIGARVIGRDSSPFVRALRVRIDRGDPLIRSGLPVVTAEGIAGKVGRVYGSYADVILAVDPKSSIDVLIQRTGGRGLLRGIDGTNRYVCRIDYLLRREDVKIGDLVVSSGVAGTFPKDLPVGRISGIATRTYGLYQEVEVIPSVDFSSLDEVLIILSPPPPPAAQMSATPEPARGYLP